MVWQLLAGSVAKKAAHQKAKNATKRRAQRVHGRAVDTADGNGKLIHGPTRTHRSTDEIYRDINAGYSSVGRTREARLDRKKRTQDVNQEHTTAEVQAPQRPRRVLGRNGLLSRRFHRARNKQKRVSNTMRKMLPLSGSIRSTFFIWLYIIIPLWIIEVLGLTLLYTKEGLWEWVQATISLGESLIISAEQLFSFGYILVALLSSMSVFLIYFKLKKVTPEKDHQTGLIIALVICFLPLLHIIPVATLYAGLSISSTLIQSIKGSL